MTEKERQRREAERAGVVDCTGGSSNSRTSKCSSCGNRNAEDVAGSYSLCCNKRVESI